MHLCALLPLPFDYAPSRPETTGIISILLPAASKSAQKEEQKAHAVLRRYLANPSVAALTTLYVPRVECFFTNCIRSTLLFYFGCSRLHFRGGGRKQRFARTGVIGPLG
ncbi:uncharacterized protein TERG_12407 [Trichophyton rubrum CBS 118892]|uniref:Uncharacterized protein n=1 Tax=Trichophyton rubrum (strain ATCC MYA-4607 / CBS 118892) TaxID=559305 RepID=A0A080WW76_TRIRC|nr:uncharacterized protein TERG_12407 [Trichophyton rubrum CBS 118892]KFL62318.1 hypothetical protein TERG_12407 [Trichophyton rubrum CBS 118892]